jgi:hypothetical protein
MSFFKKGVAGLFQMFFGSLIQKLTRRQMDSTPKNCTLQGYFYSRELEVPTPREQATLRKPWRKRLVVTTDENEAYRDPQALRMRRGTRLPPPPVIPVWRYQWPDNGRKSKRHAQAAA